LARFDRIRHVRLSWIASVSVPAASKRELSDDACLRFSRRPGQIYPQDGLCTTASLRVRLAVSVTAVRLGWVVQSRLPAVSDLPFRRS
jgi:hypothetical protein